MTTIASQLILHPTASQTLRVLGTTVGRDKIYRAVQYFARAFAWFLIYRGYNVEAARWNALKSHLGTGRKLMRLGKPLEHLQAALKAAQLISNPAEQIATVGRQLGYAGYLIYDTVVWANAVKFINLSPEKAEKYTKATFRFWLLGILCSIANGVLKAGRLANEEKAVGKPSKAYEAGVSTETERAQKLAAIQKERAAVRYQFVIDMLDVWIPASNLGYSNFNDGFLGIFGLVSSVMALRTQWSAVNKAK